MLAPCPDQRGIVAALAQLLYGHETSSVATEAGSGLGTARQHSEGCRSVPATAGALLRALRAGRGTALRATVARRFRAASHSSWPDEPPI